MVIVVIMMVIVSIVITVVTVVIVIRVVVVFDTSAIALMPFVVIAHRIPISRYPHMPRSRARWNNCNHSRWRWCADDNSHRNLGFSCPGQN